MSSWRHRLLLDALAILVLAAPVHSTEPQADSAGISPGWEVAGTTLVLHPRAPFERGFVRIVGPEGYGVRKSLDESTPPIVDLLAEGRLQAEARGGPKPESSREVPDRPLDLLPDGVYRFEAILAGPTGTARLAGSLFAGGGRLVGTGTDEFSAPAPSAPAAASGAQAQGRDQAPPPGILSEPEQLILTDDNNNGLTWVELQADSPENVRLENWQIQNTGGDFRIVEDETGSQDAPRLTLLQDTAQGRVGIGTTAPEEILHLASTSAHAPRIRIEDNFNGLDDFWDLRVANDIFQLRDTNDIEVVRLRKGAPLLSLVINSTGVTINSDFSVSSSRSAKRNLLEIDPASVLDRLAELPILEWEYRNSSGARHLGPVAESFHDAFGLGTSDQTISPLDLGGVALAAIQGLKAEIDAQRTATESLLAEKDERIERLAAERELVTERLEALEAKLAQLLTESREAAIGTGPDCLVAQARSPAARHR